MNWLIVAYLGWGFHGSQIQPSLRTVEGEIDRVIGRFCRKRPKLLSRTDAGVSARGNILEVDSYKDAEELSSMINSALEDVWVWGLVEGEKTVLSREYRYFIPRPLNLRRAREAIRFLGRAEDLRPFVKDPPGPVPKPEIGIMPLGDWTVIWFRARSFMWQMVRRMVNFIQRVSDGADPEEEFRAAEARGSYDPADPRFLVLWETRTPGSVRVLGGLSASRSLERMSAEAGFLYMLLGGIPWRSWTSR